MAKQFEYLIDWSTQELIRQTDLELIKSKECRPMIRELIELSGNYDIRPGDAIEVHTNCELVCERGGYDVTYDTCQSAIVQGRLRMVDFARKSASFDECEWPNGVASDPIASHEKAWLAIVHESGVMLVAIASNAHATMT